MPATFALVQVEQIIASGRVADEVLRLARVQLADVIVMGAKSSWATHLSSLGTTAHRVISHAECPVLLLPGHLCGAKGGPLESEERPRELAIS